VTGVGPGRRPTAGSPLRAGDVRTCQVGRDDSGFVAVATAGLILVLVSVAALLAALGAVAVARHRAASAADLAALAGAQHALEGVDPACRVATRVAQAQGAHLEGCALEGAQVLVEVSVRPAGRIGELGVARARARAGPAAPCVPGPEPRGPCALRAPGTAGNSRRSARVLPREGDMSGAPPQSGPVSSEQRNLERFASLPGEGPRPVPRSRSRSTT
jgi:secretion/DNA translocation related TadE-like protein